MSCPGTIFAPKRLDPARRAVHSNPGALFALLALRGWKVVYSDTISSEQVDGGRVVAAKCPQGSYIGAARSLLALPDDIRVDLYVDEVHTYNEEFREEWGALMGEALLRAHTILSCYADPFLDRWPQHAGKVHHFPHFWCHSRKPLKSAKSKVLLSGAVGCYYPLRKLVSEAENCYVEDLPHPKDYEQRITTTGADYIRTISKYFAAIATGVGDLQYAVGKYLEIPAAGALLLGEPVSDLARLGFVPMVHYVPITERTVFDVIREVCEERERYEPIRQRGHLMVLRDHGIARRAQQWEDALGVGR